MAIKDESSLSPSPSHPKAPVHLCIQRSLKALFLTDGSEAWICSCFITCECSLAFLNLSSIPSVTFLFLVSSTLKTWIFTLKNLARTLLFIVCSSHPSTLMSGRGWMDKWITVHCNGWNVCTWFIILGSSLFYLNNPCSVDAFAHLQSCPATVQQLPDRSFCVFVGDWKKAADRSAALEGCRLLCI